MVALNESFASEYPSLGSKNRVGDFFAHEAKSRRANRLPAQQPRREKAHGYDKTASGMFFYGFRYYDPVTGRWPSRDPIGKEGGLNVYAMVANDTVSKWDVLGQKPPCSDFSKTRGRRDSAEGRTDIQDSTPVPNGCSNPAPILANVLFRPVCNGHDICYQTCGSDRSSCDSQFLSDMRDICNSFLPWLPQVAASCHASALGFYGAVVAFGGSFHEEGQDERCKWEACCE